MHKRIDISKHEKESIINEITRRHILFTTYKSRKDRLLHIPFKTALYYILSTISYIKPFKVRYRTLWKDTLSFYMPEGNAIYYYGFFEANVTNFLLRILKEGDVFIDVGAHIGYYSNLCSHIVGQTGKVYSFEPTPRTFATLQQNTAGFIQTQAINAAALDTETTISFVDYGPKYSAFNSFEDRTDNALSFLDKEKKHIVTNTIVLDTFFEQHSIKPTIVKIDAEGADFLVLKGMEKTLNDTRPLISIEIAGGEEWKANHQKSIEILKKYNYISYLISANGLLQKGNVDHDYEYENVLFVPEEKTNTVHDILEQ